MPDNPTDIKKGMSVDINPQTDRTRRITVKGTVAEVLTKATDHPHGILVLLESGEKGRVKNIHSSEGIETEKITPESNKIEIKLKPLSELIQEGENHHIEFKSNMLWSARLRKEDIKKSTSKDISQYGRDASKVIIAKTLAGFLNTDGGTLIVGIKENKNSMEDEIIGVESDFHKLADACKDGYRRMILDSIIKPYFPSFIFNHINDNLQISFEMIDGNLVCGIRVNKSDEKVFLKIKNEEVFLIRIDASTRFLQGEQIVDYCMKHFN